MEPSNSDVLTVQTISAFFLGILLFLVGTIGYFMRRWFSNFEDAMSKDRADRKQELRDHREEHRKIWEGQSKIGGLAQNALNTAEGANNRIGDHIANHPNSGGGRGR